MPAGEQVWSAENTRCGHSPNRSSAHKWLFARLSSSQPVRRARLSSPGRRSRHDQPWRSLCSGGRSSPAPVPRAQCLCSKPRVHHPVCFPRWCVPPRRLPSRSSCPLSRWRLPVPLVSTSILAKRCAAALHVLHSMPCESTSSGSVRPLPVSLRWPSSSRARGCQIGRS